MNRIEIIEAALLKKHTPRIPCFPLIDAAFASAYSRNTLRAVQLRPEIHAKALSLCTEKLPVDGVYINLCLKDGQAEKISDAAYLLDDALTLVIPENDVLSIKETDITSLEDSRIETAELFHPGMLETYRLIPEKVKEECAILTALTGTFSHLAFLYGVQNLLIELIDNPEKVRQALEKRHTVVLRQAEDLCSAGARFVWIGEGLGSGSLISPEQYEKFVLPYEQDIANFFRKRDVLTILHICGNTNKTLPSIAASGVDGFDLDYPVPIEAAMEHLSPNISIKGNINPSLFLSNRLEDLKDACSALKGKTKNLPGFIMSTGCLVPRDSDPRAFTIMKEHCDRNHQQGENTQ